MSKQNNSRLFDKCDECGNEIKNIVVDKGKKHLCSKCFNNSTDVDKELGEEYLSYLLRGQSFKQYQKRVDKIVKRNKEVLENEE